MTGAPASGTKRTTPSGDPPVDGPPLPPGRRVELPGRGTTFVREVAGPADAPAVLLLHGWLASGGLNWFTAFDELARHFRVIAPDLRGHARGLRSRRIFRLADCADDCAETLVELGTGPVIAVGYSMGGPVAQLLWRRHRDLCAGLVLCATTGGFMPGTRERLASQAVMGAVAGTTRLGSLLARVPGAPPMAFPFRRAATLPAWAAAEMRRHDVRMVIEAGHSISTYHARWLGEIDVPTAALVTTQDRAVAPRLQVRMASAIPGATRHELHDGHLACARASFAAPLRQACLDVAGRAFG